MGAPIRLRKKKINKLEPLKSYTSSSDKVHDKNGKFTLVPISSITPATGAFNNSNKNILNDAIEKKIELNPLRSFSLKTEIMQSPYSPASSLSSASPSSSVSSPSHKRHEKFSPRYQLQGTRLSLTTNQLLQSASLGESNIYSIYVYMCSTCRFFAEVFKLTNYILITTNLLLLLVVLLLLIILFLSLLLLILLLSYYY